MLCCVFLSLFFVCQLPPHLRREIRKFARKAHTVHLASCPMPTSRATCHVPREVHAMLPVRTLPSASCSSSRRERARLRRRTVHGRAGAPRTPPSPILRGGFAARRPRGPRAAGTSTPSAKILSLHAAISARVNGRLARPCAHAWSERHLLDTQVSPYAYVIPRAHARLFSDCWLLSFTLRRSWNFCSSTAPESFPGVKSL